VKVVGWLVGWLVGVGWLAIAGEDGKLMLMSNFVNKETRFQQFRWGDQGRTEEIVL